MLDEHDRQTILVMNVSQQNQLGAFVVVHAGGGLVKQQKLRVGSEGARNLQAALQSIGQGARLMVFVGLDAEAAQILQRLLSDALVFPPGRRQAEKGGKNVVGRLAVQRNADVFKNGHF